MRWMTLTALLFTSIAQAGEVVIVENEHSLKITIDNQVFAVYNLGHNYAKPFMYPVAAPGALQHLHAAGHGKVYVAQEQAKLKNGGTAEFGSLLQIEHVELPWLKIEGQDDFIHQLDVIPVDGFIVRVIEAEASKEYDHVHHKGIWLSIDEVNDIRYWAEKGVIRNSEASVHQASGEHASFTVINHWLGATGEPLLSEATHITVFADRLLTYDTTFTATGESVTFNDTKEGLFGIRLPDAMREAVANSPVVGSNGEVGTKLLWGKTMDWIDYTGSVDGHLCGVAVMDHPENFRPSRYHVRDYGLFSISPFGESSYTNGAQAAAPYTIEKDGTLRLRYGLYVHAGDTNSAHVADTFRQFVNATRP